ncbi:hypothetical protein Sjap_003327 [Stephania japonica]|uniref:Uncharacterized protein n=1 Tax=Stephania japonica TaxID=461633 RepID=A0AAP0KNI8_9MAGN
MHRMVVGVPRGQLKPDPTHQVQPEHNVAPRNLPRKIRPLERRGSDAVFAVVDGGGHGVVVDSDILVGVSDGGNGEVADVEAGAVGAEGEPEDEGEDAADEEDGEEDGAEEFDEAAAEAVVDVVDVESGAVAAAGRGCGGLWGWGARWGCPCGRRGRRGGAFSGMVGGGREGVGGYVRMEFWMVEGRNIFIFWGGGDCLVMVVWF